MSSKQWPYLCLRHTFDTDSPWTSTFTSYSWHASKYWCLQINDSRMPQASLRKSDRAHAATAYSTYNTLFLLRHVPQFLKPISTASHDGQWSTPDYSSWMPQLWEKRHGLFLSFCTFGSFLASSVFDLGLNLVLWTTLATNKAEQSFSGFIALSINFWDWEYELILISYCHSKQILPHLFLKLLKATSIFLLTCTFFE